MTSLTDPRIVALPPGGGPVERVVFAVDDSHGAVAAAGWLAERAAFVSLAVEIVVVEGQGAPPGGAEGTAWRMREYIAARIPTARTTVRVLHGDVVDSVQAAAFRGDLVVLGSNRTRLWQHIPVATRSTRLAEEAVRPTALVPSSWLPDGGPVVVGVAAGGDAAVDWAAATAAGSGRPLLLVRGGILRRPADPPDEDGDLRLLERAEERALAAAPGIEVRTVLDHEGVVPVLAAAGQGADALVVGAESGPRVGGILRGVLEQVPCPVVVVPDGVRS
jgi:nucleotide-binding universal stress UspA family protein